MTEETIDSSPASTSRPRPAGSRTRSHGYVSSLRSTHPLDSTPSDSDWVSPFTLPPLPTFQRARGTTHRPTSPQHQRSASSVYYAAAWGSPYATPSPRTSPAPVRRSLSQEGPSTSARRIRRGNSLIPDIRSERPNWLSDSEGSVGASAETPTRDNFGKSRKKVRDHLPLSANIGHHVNESIATVTQDDYVLASKMTDRHPTMSLAVEEEKPLPRLPQQQTMRQSVETAEESSTSATRPGPPSFPSFQRPRKKVPWNGKTCIIALPLEDATRFEGRSLLSRQEIQERLKKWEADGYNTVPFLLSDMSGQQTGQGTGQSRPLYPEPDDIWKERQTRNFSVRIPDQAEWESWVEYIKEEKLRALGVTSSVSEPPASVRSPFSNSMSRTSSHYPSMPISPSVGPSSVASNPVRIGSNQFSPSFNPSTAVSSQAASVAASVASPRYNGMPGPMHQYKLSVVEQTAQARMTSPFDPNAPWQAPYGPGPRSPANYFAPRPTSISPAGLGGVQSLGEVLSPVSPFPDGVAQLSRSASMLGQIQRQQQDLQAQLLQQQRQQTASMPQPSRSDPVQPPSIDAAAPTLLHIVSPTPRSHRHNLSEALQKEIDEAEQSLEDTDRLEATTANGDVAQKYTVPQKRATESVTDRVEPDLPVISPPLENDDRSDFETNPSIAASPLLVEDKSPFAKWPANEVTTTPPQPAGFGKSHKLQPSLSKLNVEAKPFDPRGIFTSSNFAFGHGTFGADALTSKPIANLFRDNLSGRPTRPVAPSTQTSFNVAAPEFTPLAQSKPPPTRGNFDFSSSTFNVEAPEFNPSQSLNSARGSIIDSAAGTSPRADKIFDDVVIDPSSKAVRRSVKAVPIIKPASRPSSKEGPDVQAEDAEDEGGRPIAPTDRQKRARHSGGDGDHSPVYAESSPFNHRGILAEMTEPTSAIAMTTHHREILAEIVKEAARTSPVEDSATEAHLELEKDKIGASVLPSPDAVAHERPHEQAHDGNWSPFAFQDRTDAATFAGARPQPTVNGENTSSDAPAEVKKPTTVAGVQDEVEASSASTPASKPASTLSPLAPPFRVGGPPMIPGHVHTTPTQSRKASGLMASRYATSSPAAAEIVVEEDDEVEGEEDCSKTLPTGLEHTEPKPDPDLLDTYRGHAHDEEDVDDSDSSSVVAEEKLVDDLEELPDSDVDRESGPSYEEIDAVMKQFEDNPDLGVERHDTPSNVTPLIDMRLPPNFRSDAPSPSPRRIRHSYDMPTASVERPVSNLGLGIGVHRLTDGTEQVSDWDEMVSPHQEAKLHGRSRFFDSHVNELVDGILENRLGPMERTLQVIQHSIALMATKPSSRHGRPSVSTVRKDSDADDEDEYDAFEGYVDYRARSPVTRKGRKPDQLKQIIMDATAAYQAQLQESTQVQTSEMAALLAEMKELAQQVQPSSRQAELKNVVEDVINTHPRLRGHRVQQSHDDGDKFRLQITGLESMLKMAEDRANDEARLRREAEDELATVTRRLRLAEEEAAEHRESSEEAERSLEAFLKEKEAYQDLEHELDLVNLKNTALEKTLEEYRVSREQWEEKSIALEKTLAEYRVSSEQWREEIREERAANQELHRTLQAAQDQLDERSQSRENLRQKVDQLHLELRLVVQDLATEQAEWRQREHDLIGKYHGVQAALEHETRQREKRERELEELEREHKQNLHFRTSHEHAQQDVARLQELVHLLTQENKTHQDGVFKLERELAYAREVTQTEVSKAVGEAQAELERVHGQMESLRVDYEAQIARLQSRLDDAELDIEEHKTKHDSVVAEMTEAHSQALQDAVEKGDAALQEQYEEHQKKLSDLRDRHTRALHNSSDDRHRLEHHLNEKLSLSNDKVQHLESKIVDLEQRLQITQSAARAAVEAATAKGADLPTPAPSVVASPPHAPASSASLTFVRGSDIPEKISPQALRESVMVLQDQLQAREKTIEKLEAEMALLDKDAPSKLKERDTEISWLRELLAVRLDDLDDLVKILSQHDFDRNAAQDAAIRLKASLQMEQQLRERTTSGTTTTLPSLSTLTSPRALPMAAAAAWGNWRKARDASVGALSNLASNIGDQTPSRSTSGSPGGFLSSMMTPPSTSVRTPMIGDNHAFAPPSMRPLASAAKRSTSEARPLRAYNAQARVLSSRQQDPTPLAQNDASRPLAPSTPPIMTQASFGADADADADTKSFMDDVDDDASPLDGRQSRPFDEPTTTA